MLAVIIIGLSNRYVYKYVCEMIERSDPTSNFAVMIDDSPSMRHGQKRGSKSKEKLSKTCAGIFNTGGCSFRDIRFFYSPSALPLQRRQYEVRRHSR